MALHISMDSLRGHEFPGQFNRVKAVLIPYGTLNLNKFNAKLFWKCSKLKHKLCKAALEIEVTTKNNNEFINKTCLFVNVLFAHTKTIKNKIVYSSCQL